MRQSIFATLALIPFAAATPAHAGRASLGICAKDTDCPGKLICERHHCVDSVPFKVEVPPPPAAPVAPAAVAPAPVAAPQPVAAPPPVLAVPTPATLEVPVRAPPAPVVQAAPDAPPPPLVDAPPTPVQPPEVAAQQNPQSWQGWQATEASEPPSDASLTPLLSATPDAQAPAPSAKGSEGYKGAAWGLTVQEFQTLKAAVPDAESRDIIASVPGKSTNGVWGDAIAVLLGTPVESDALVLRALPARFSSAYVPQDEAHYLFYEGKLVAALVEVGATNYEPIKAELKRRAKARGSLARKVPLREGRQTGTLAADLFDRGATRVALCRLQHPIPGAGDLVTSLRLLYFSNVDFENLTADVQRAAAALRLANAPVRDSTARDLSKIQ